ncbi:[FeFe]-hydrogenase H-cluster maturation GTPase HydF [Anaerobutyricum hallii]|uniref:[FeFe]-hydrogenase H-cluster maturation GTPase HydF n=1 Tax=Anaerobutyricum hallii TaxID=39488 RepID=A0A285PRV1_9FIRM|nr:[FeFe] hydrogenase H-cluster maturation GTPase HydF [Anaerobutyricum hallii]SOB71876.1 [FeFe]-hydrogenase H-cluster maturation GTPase HydF [Anaerobutyricum hallii]
MSLNDTPSGERIHIGFFGRRNAGKSSVVNAVTGQELAVVSDTKGTTTDPVSKAMELLPLGPVLIIDTPGFDDEGQLGELRVRKTKQILNKTDIAVLVIDAVEGLKQCDEELLSIFKEKDIPYLLVYNKEDMLKEEQKDPLVEDNNNVVYVSALQKTHIQELKEKLAKQIKTEDQTLQLVGDLVQPSDLIILVIPIDSAAPKGRLILPQQQVIRDILEAGGAAICVKETELSKLLTDLGNRPSMVITDSQAFAQVSQVVPEEILLTSFSILMARYKGFLDEAVQGAAAIRQLKDGDRVLISEGCTHHRQCDDIGTVKIPRWLKNYTGKNLIIETSSGREFPEDLSPFSLIIHCGGCMLNGREMKYRMKCAKDQHIPFTNYGIAIAHMQGILERSIQVFPDLVKKIKSDL